MMEYKKIIIPGIFAEKDTEHIIVTFDDDSYESFPVDENNPRYIQFLAELEEQA